MAIKKIKLKRPEAAEYQVRVETDREKAKFIKRVESIVRGSMEYKDYIAFLKEYVDMKHCAFFNSVENSPGNRVKIEIHHEPFTLFDIVKVVLNKHLSEGIPINDLYIADEVMEIHYKNMVGLIPLCKTLHQAYHHGTQVKIPLNLVYGEYKSFVDDYMDYMDEDIIDKLERKINETNSINMEKLENTLTPNYVYITVEGFTLPQKIVAKDIA